MTVRGGGTTTDQETHPYDHVPAQLCEDKQQHPRVDCAQRYGRDVTKAVAIRQREKRQGRCKQSKAEYAMTEQVGSGCGKGDDELP